MKHHFFVCTNRRPAHGPKPSCAGNGSEEVLFALRDERERRGLSVDIYITAAGCLGRCPTAGASIVVYPEGVWYTGVTVADVPELVEQHMVNGRVVERLRDSQLR
ncbi:MAG: (2Fe-2S) ferredoxin domain-containing protein [Deltaproteobacteria bacterium]|nr:(2Fe-2S) ferredoxin domain-containing protein [Deltaproteobacteria bacterium]